MTINPGKIPMRQGEMLVLTFFQILLPLNIFLSLNPFALELPS
jgi:hypothetical protein